MFKMAVLPMLSGTCYSCPILKKIALSQQIFEKKTLKYQISLKSVQSEQGCSMRTDGWMDRYDEATSRCSQIYEST
jgi:hypothetical protein